MKEIKISAIFAGKQESIVDKKGQKYISSYKKKPVNEAVFVNYLGLENDTQGDSSHHGGVDKAVCVYTQKSYDFLKEAHGIELPPCAFGENLILEDVDDCDFCIGDVYKCGDILFEVSQPRPPCWRISSVMGVPNLTGLVVKEAKTGFYLRVLKEGILDINNPLELVSRPNDGISIELLSKCSFDAKNNQENIRKILSCSELAAAFRTTLVRRLKNQDSGLQDWQTDEFKDKVLL